MGGFLHSLGLAMAPVLEVERRRSRLRVGGSAISGLGVLATAAYTVTQAQAAHITVGDAQMLIGAAVGAAVSVRGLVYTGLGLYENGLFLLDLVTFLDRGQSHAHVIQPAAPAPRARVSTDKDIRFEHVSFAYPGARRRAISDVSFVVPSGSTVALVGRNGAGKTTLVSLLTRMYEPTHGRILFDGVDIREHDVDELRARFGVVYQDFTRYALTARHNVGYGDVERMYDDRHLDAAARRAGIRDIVLQLPKQWDSYLGCLFEEGVDLSLGEWQRMALARALVREPEILVLDEPSASLDPIAEQGLDREYLGLRQGCTVLMISHRLRNVRAADNILVLDAGAIAEAGSHRELMARHGLYEALFTAQARAYAP